MGAANFFTKALGETAEGAFLTATEDAAWQHGHGGYTGTIAEKSEFVMIAVPAEQEPEAYAYQLMRDDDPRVRDKWGPAGCIKLSEDNWLFFGRASS